METLVGRGIIKKETNTPSSGYTTYTLLTNIDISCNSNSDNPTLNNYIQLLDGYIFDGNGYNITIKNNSVLESDVVDAPFKMTEYSHTGVLTAKGNTIKNLYLSGNAPCSTGPLGGSSLLLKVGTSYSNSSLGARHITVQNCICTRTRHNYTNVPGIVAFIPKFYPEKTDIC